MSPDVRLVHAHAWNLAISTVRVFVLSTTSRMAALIRTRRSRTTALARDVPSTLGSASSDAALSPSRTSATSSFQPLYSVLSLSRSWSSSILRTRPPERRETRTGDRDRGHGHADAQGPQPGREFFRVAGRHDENGLTDPRDAAPVDESGLVSRSPVDESLPAENDLAHAGRDGSGAAGHIVGHEEAFSARSGIECHEYIYVCSHIIMFLREVSESTPPIG